MRVVFVTHNDLGLACLEELVDLGADVRGVFTRPEQDCLADQTDLSVFVEGESIPLHRVESVNTDATKAAIRDYDPEVLFVVGWSRLVDADVLNIPSVTALGMHPAPLPRGRGRAPIAWSLIEGLDETALSFFHLIEEADAGDLVGQEPIPIDVEDDAASLYEKTVEAGRTLIRQYYPEFENGHVPRQPQESSAATWWPKREPHHGLIDWNRPPRELYDWIRGQTRPYPGAFSYLDDRKVTVWAANPPAETQTLASPGEIVYRNGVALGVAAWEGIIELTEVQVEDDDTIPAGDLLNRYEYDVGYSFDNARDRLRR